MLLLIDAQLPPQLAQWLRSSGHQAEAVRDLGMRDAADDEIWAYASAKGCVIITKDEDFAEMAARLPDGPAVLWIRCGNVLNRELRTRFESAWPEAQQLLAAGAKLIELR
jgi:predicted nuclease of predicted toxin-antitoxin system